MLDGQKCKAGEGCAIEAVVEGEEAEASVEGVSADEEIGKDAAGTGVALFSAAGDVGLKGEAGGSPDGLIQIPVNGDSGIPAEGVQEGFTAGG